MSDASTGLSADERNAVGHAAVSLGEHLSRATRTWTKIGLNNTDAAYLADQLCHYRTACKLSGQSPSAAIVTLVEQAIAAAEDAS